MKVWGRASIERMTTCGGGGTEGGGRDISEAGLEMGRGGEGGGGRRRSHTTYKLNHRWERVKKHVT